MLSVKELFKVGHGPSSSHTIAPMRMCWYILDHYEKEGIDHLKITLYGSFALTGKGHLLDRAVDEVFAKYPHEYVWDIKSKPAHPNMMRIEVFGKGDKLIANRLFTSVGGGTFTVEGDEPAKNIYPYKTFAEMKAIIKKEKLTPFQFLCKHESKEELIKLYEDMIKSFEGTIKSGLSKTGVIEGLVAFDRRAKVVYDTIKPTDTEWCKRIKSVSAYALATNEEAVAYGMVVTAPTCGSAGTMPAAYKWAVDKYKPTKERIYEAFSAAALIGITIKQNGSVAGATGGCQAEVGVATGLAAAMYAVIAYNADIDEVEKAGEVGLQQLVGMTCDAVGQCAYVPCIQRNAIYAMRAISSAEQAHLLKGQRQLVHIDDTIAVLYQSGNELNEGYKETSKLGLAKHCKYTLKFNKNIQFDEEDK
ncbi:MAG: L-serine ammonia-lyase, iron-sulfur-dependent, subunit alpha [Mycoplasma sp.]|nr:L-serine ammonia-lyase, iron-sulfur-dependent, subunit alpha [Candidatus Hennigella equi]